MQNGNKRASWQTIWPLCLVAVIPLVAMRHRYETHLGQYTWFGEEWRSDLFLYAKMCAIIVVSALMICNLLLRQIQKKEKVTLTKRDWVQWSPLLGYLFLSFLSTVCSKFSYFGWHGGCEQFESIWVVLGYGIIAFYAFLYMDTRENAGIVIDCLVVSACIIGLIGVFQTFGLDVFCSSGIANLLGIDTNSEVRIWENRAYGTLGNPNYMGVFCVLMVPILLSALIEQRLVWKRILYGVTTILLCICLFGSISKTGIAVLLFVLLCMLLFYRQQIGQHKYTFFILIGCLLIGIVCLFAWKGTEIVDSFREKANIQCEPLENVTKVQTLEEYVELEYQGKNYSISMDVHAQTMEEFMVVLDEKQDRINLQTTESENVVIIPGTEVSILFGYINDEDIGFILKGISPECVFIYKDGCYQYYLSDSKIEKLDTFAIEAFAPLNGYEKLFSYRGYIWSRTIPILKHHILLGTGRDTFVMYFPNNDIFVKYQMGYDDHILTKPHNIYLQIMCQDGLVAGLLCIFVWIFYLVQAMRNCWKSEKRCFAEVGILMGITGYLMMGFMNDSMVGVAPVFWLLLGYGIRLNHTARNEEEQSRNIKQKSGRS